MSHNWRSNTLAAGDGLSRWRPQMGIGVIRVSVGLEDRPDPIADLAWAVERI